MNRIKAVLTKEQATAIIHIFRTNQLIDLANYLNVHINPKNKLSYKLCLDCPIDSQPRIQAKLLDIAPALDETNKQAIESIIWEEYDD